jgi:hypothetical protein
VANNAEIVDVARLVALIAGPDFFSKDLGKRKADDLSECEGQEYEITLLDLRQPLAQIRKVRPENYRKDSCGPEDRHGRRHSDFQTGLNLDPFMIRETFLYLTETAFGSHPCRVVSITYCEAVPFHDDAKGQKDQLRNGLSAWCAVSFLLPGTAEGRTGGLSSEPFLARLR